MSSITFQMAGGKLMAYDGHFRRDKLLTQAVENAAAKEAETGAKDTSQVKGWLQELDAPVAHKFAAGVSGVESQDVRDAAQDDDELLDEVFVEFTPVDLAIVCDRVDRLNVLLQMGADPNNENGFRCRTDSIGKTYAGNMTYYKLINCSTT